MKKCKLHNVIGEDEIYETRNIMSCEIDCEDCKHYYNDYDIAQEKQIALNCINESFEDLKKQKELILNLDIKPITEEEWFEIRQTPIIGSDLILKIFKATFAEGTDFKYTMNGLKYDSIDFKMKNIEIKIPINWNICSIFINNKFYNYEDKGRPVIKESHMEKRLKELIKLIDSGNYNWYDLECIFHPKYKDKKIRLFIKYLLNFKQTKKIIREIDYYRKLINNIEKANKNSIKRYYKKRRLQNREIRDLKYIISQLQKFSENIGVYGVDVNTIMNTEETINKKPVINLGDKKNE